MKLAVSNEPPSTPEHAFRSRGEVPGSAILAAVDSERRRIERDLHDGTQQCLLSAMMILQEARDHIRRDQAQDAAPLLELAMDRLLDTSAELRRVTRSIYPALLASVGLVGALEALVDRSPVSIELRASALPRLPEPVELAVYFTATEALANVLKHAHADHVVICLGPSGDGQLTLSIADDGVGTVDELRGTGLRGLRERIQATGGVLTVRSDHGRGTVIEASWHDPRDRTVRIRPQ